jgi:hypothetical protein
MDEQVTHDPRTKQQIKDAIYDFLYAPALKQFEQRLTELVTKNSVMLGNAEHSFIYKGNTYSVGTNPLPRKMNRLAKPLQPYMEEYLTDIQKLNGQELPYVLGFIGQVLNASSSLQDYFEVLPTAVHRPVEKLVLSCPCRAKKLSQLAVNSLLIQNQVPISLMKARMVANLLI